MSWLAFIILEIKIGTGPSLKNLDARFRPTYTGIISHVETLSMGLSSLYLHLNPIQNGIVCWVEESPSSQCV